MPHAVDVRRACLTQWMWAGHALRSCKPAPHHGDAQLLPQHHAMETHGHCTTSQPCPEPGSECCPVKASTDSKQGSAHSNKAARPQARRGARAPHLLHPACCALDLRLALLQLSLPRGLRLAHARRHLGLRLRCRGLQLRLAAACCLQARLHAGLNGPALRM